MATRRNLLAGGAAITAALALGGCGSTAGTGGRGGGSGRTVPGLRIMVPNSPGGGYDTTARTAAKVLEDARIASAVQVFNLPGASGTVGLQRTVNERGNGTLAMQMGLGVVGASYTTRAAASLTETTPLARLIEEAGALVVARDSPYRTMRDLVRAWRADPTGIAVGGGSSPGGPDHLLPMQLAQTAGIDPRQVDYRSFDGGGELLPALLGGQVAFAASGFGEFLDQVSAGQVRVLAVTSADPIPSLIDVPTLRAAGLDLVFTNWRGIVAPPGISAEDRRTWVEVLTRMHESVQWRSELVKRGWGDAFLTGDGFGEFLTEQDRSVAALLRQLGLT